MPSYVLSPFKQSPQLFTPGQSAYLWGSYNNKTGPTTGTVIFVKTNGTTTATVQIKILSGNIPANGSLISVVGSSVNANFNVVNAAVSNVTALNSPDDGTYSLTFTISSTATPTTFTADAAQFIIPQPEVSEALVAGASVPVCMPYNNFTANLNQAITAVVSFPSLPTSVVISLQQAVHDIDSEYVTIATIATVAGGVVSGSPQVTVDPTLGRFFRFSNGTVTGGSSPTIIAKLLL